MINNFIIYNITLHKIKQMFYNFLFNIIDIITLIMGVNHECNL